jgi:hypothetical protein
MSESLDQKDGGATEVITKRLQFIVPSDIISRFSNYTIVQGDAENQMFTMSFYEIQKPALMGTPEEIKEVLSKTDGIPAVCVSRLIISAKHFKNLIGAMQNNLERFDKSQ